MKVFMALLTLVIAVDAYAVDRSRCGKDQFGNIICMDKDGVLGHVPLDFEKEDSELAASGVSDAEKKRREEIREKIRCGLDSFGNKVCR